MDGLKPEPFHQVSGKLLSVCALQQQATHTRFSQTLVWLYCIWLWGLEPELVQEWLPQWRRGQSKVLAVGKGRQV